LIEQRLLAAQPRAGHRRAHRLLAREHLEAAAVERHDHVERRHAEREGECEDLLERSVARAGLAGLDLRDGHSVDAPAELGYAVGKLLLGPVVAVPNLPEPLSEHLARPDLRVVVHSTSSWAVTVSVLYEPYWFWHLGVKVN